MVHMAMKVERQLKRKGTVRYTSVSNTTWKSKWDKNDPAEAKRKTEPPKGKDEGTNNKPKVESQPSRNRDIKCFKCLGSGHIASQFSNRLVMIMRDNGEVITESEDDSDGMPELVDTSDDDEVVYLVTGESLVARRTLNTHIKVDDTEQQRENIFHTRCYVNNKVCSRIIDGRSCTNVASTILVVITPFLPPGFSRVSARKRDSLDRASMTRRGLATSSTPMKKVRDTFPKV